jgi:hypothetical protein
MDRISMELELLRRFYPDLEHVAESGWFRLRHYRLPTEPGWSSDEVDVAVQFPAGYPGQKPYAFYVTPILSLKSGVAVNNVTESTGPPWPGPWQKFSWDAPEWFATTDLTTGSNMLNFVLTIADRLRQGA